VHALRRERFGPFLANPWGFTPRVFREGQSQLLGSCFLRKR